MVSVYHNAEDSQCRTDEDGHHLPHIDPVLVSRLEKNRRRHVHENPDHDSHQFARMIRQIGVGTDQHAERCHAGEYCQPREALRPRQLRVEQHSKKRDRNRVVVENDAPQQQLPRCSIMVRMSIAECRRFQESMQTQSHQDPHWQSPMDVMRMAVLHTEGKVIKRQLDEESSHDQQPQPQAHVVIVPRMIVVIQLRQQMENRQAEEIGAGEGVKQLDVLRLIQLKPENTQRTENNTRNKDQILHTMGRTVSLIANDLQAIAKANP